MIRRRLLAAAVGTGVLLAAVPALAAVDAGSTGAESGEARALALLERAAQVGRQLSYRGTQYVASWQSGSSDSALVELEHHPATGSVVSGGGDPVDTTAALDPRMLGRLSAAYVLAVVGPGRCTGRTATVVEARRTGGDVAGRFWVDHATGMLLRREVFDGEGHRVRSSAFVDLDVRGAESAPVMALAARSGAERPAQEAVARLRDAGWLVPQDLPAGFRLFETRRSGQVLHLAYTDGLSTLSLFAQRGRLGSGEVEGFAAEEVGGRPVWVRRAAPERVVWSGGGRVWTLVSDAPEDAVLAAVGALPRDKAADDGLRTRLGRGLSRLGGMLNPFG